MQLQNNYIRIQHLRFLSSNQWLDYQIWPSGKNLFITSPLLEILVVLKGQSYNQALELATKKSYSEYEA